MTTSISTNDTSALPFKTFPEFSKLTFGDRKKYELLVRDYPPFSGYAFPTLMKWWNTLDSCAVSLLQDNLILSYWMPGSEKMSGLSLVGTNKIDSTICMVFDELLRKGEQPRLVHIPEFVLQYIEHPELFFFKPERSNDEYVLDLEKYFPIKSAVSFRRHRIKKFLQRTQETKSYVRRINLRVSENRRQLLELSNQWPHRKTVNQLVKHSQDAMRLAIEDAVLLGTEAIGLYVDDTLQAYMLFNTTQDMRYISFSHLMVNSEIAYIYDYSVYVFAEWLMDKGARYANIDADFGVASLRMLKTALGPVNFFRKYTIEPAKEVISLKG